MVAGLPGTGIGGIFYLMSAICMPIRELPRLMRGKSSLRRWKLIVKQWGLSSGIMIGFWITGSLLAMLIPSKAYLHHSSSHNVLKTKPLFIALFILLIILSIVEISRFFIPKPNKTKSI